MAGNRVANWFMCNVMFLSRPKWGGANLYIHLVPFYKIHVHIERRRQRGLPQVIPEYTAVDITCLPEADMTCNTQQSVVHSGDAEMSERAKDGWLFMSAFCFGFAASQLLQLIIKTVP